MPKVYATQNERSAARKQALKRAEAKRPRRMAGKFWRLVIPALTDYEKKPPRNHAGLQQLKRITLDLLHANQCSRGLSKWCIAWQTHPGSGLAHLDILLIYSKRIKNPPTRYDYLVKHGDLTKYRSLNKAILEYNLKEDQVPLINFHIKQEVLKSRVKGDLYALMEAAMLITPFKFNCHQWLDANDLHRAVATTNWSSKIRLLKQKQRVVCHRTLVAKPGIVPITPTLIRATLSQSELVTFKSWSGYQTIVNHINQIARWGCHRPHKTPNLFVTGRPNTGKTTLGRTIAKFCPAYPLGTRGGWFPHYACDVYTLLRWDEFNLRVLPYPDLLKLMEGEAMKLPQKGGHVQRADNQLIYMTSNMTLGQIVDGRFKKDGPRRMARANLKPRITEVKIPKGHSLFILQKLIVQS